MNKESFFVFLFIATIGLIGIIGVQTTGMAARYGPPEISCHYVDQDKWGQCLRVEKQIGAHCLPAEDEYKYTTKYGWFIRPCSNEKKF